MPDWSLHYRPAALWCKQKKRPIGRSFKKLTIDYQLKAKLLSLKPSLRRA